MPTIPIFFFAILALAQADGTYSTSSLDPESAADAYSRAAGLSPIVPTSDFEIRIWTRDYMLGQVEGIVVSDGARTQFHSNSTYDQGNIVIKAGPLSKRKRLNNLTEIRELVAELQPYDKSFISCPVMDGGSVIVDATVQGKAVTLQISNPGLCADNASKITTRLLVLLRD